MSRLPAEYRTRPGGKIVIINGASYDAYDFRPEQYESIVSPEPHLAAHLPQDEARDPRTRRPAAPAKPSAHPLDCSDGIVGHLHVDLQKQKWDPGALDWNRLRARPAVASSFPLQTPRLFRSAAHARRTVGRAQGGLFRQRGASHRVLPACTGPAVALGRASPRGLRGSPVLAPVRGRIVAARRAERNGSSTSFVPCATRYELRWPSSSPSSRYCFTCPCPAFSDENPIPWMKSLMQPEKAAQRAALESGAIALLDERVETGDRVGLLGSVSRGPEQGPELHFEIFTADKPPAALAKRFHYLNAATDGPIVRRAALLALADKNNDSQIDADELRSLFHGIELDRRQPLRRLVILHRHEWGSRTTLAEFMGLRELSGIPAEDRRRIYAAAIEPYVFLTDALAIHAGLPASQTVYSYNPITFLLALAAQAAQLEIPWPRDSISDGGIEARRLAHVPLDDWTKPPKSVLAGAAPPAARGRGPCAQTQRPDPAHRAATHE